jgi:hypothetical protein
MILYPQKSQIRAVKNIILSSLRAKRGNPDCLGVGLWIASSLRFSQ